MTTPYDGFPATRFWKASAARPTEQEVEFDCGRKFAFSVSDAFATAGSCFARHFATQLAARGGKVLVAEDRHPLVPADSNHGYGAFSARYGNIYTVRHLRETLEQALGLREPVFDFAQRADGRWVDMLRPRAVPRGFASAEHARVDRAWHLAAVRRMVEALDVFVFTLGLTEAWENVAGAYCYPIIPGAVAGELRSGEHRFANATFTEVAGDLRTVAELVIGANPKARILLTVSPVGLVATAEPRSVMVSTVASKSILRAAADEMARRHERVDYFPSYEIITGAYGRGRYWAEGLRDVTAQGVEVVMDVFVRSRLPDLPKASGMSAASRLPAAPPIAGDDALRDSRLAQAFEAECDEQFLDRASLPN